MPLQLEIIRATEFVRVGARGRFDLPASKAALATVAAACRKRGIGHAVLDLRELQPGPKPVFSPADLRELIATFPAAGFTRTLRLAVLYRSDPHRRARLFASLSAEQGWHVGAFGDFETAFRWLSAEPDAAAAPGEATKGTPIPIRFGGASGGAGARSMPVVKRPRQRPAGRPRPSPAMPTPLSPARGRSAGRARG